MKLPFLKSSKTTEAEVSEKIFGVEINKDLIAQLIKIYIENSHPGTKAQKNRSAVRGGGKKPWRQKGTGRARAGTSRSPLWRCLLYTSPSPRDLGKSRMPSSA